MATGGGSRFRFELTRLEVAGVIVSSAASLFIVFLLGVYAGGGLESHRAGDDERVVRLPAAPVENAALGEHEPALDDLLGKDPPQAPPARSADVGAPDKKPEAAVADAGAPEEKREAAVADAATLAVPAEPGDRVARAGASVRRARRIRPRAPTRKPPRRRRRTRRRPVLPKRASRLPSRRARPRAHPRRAGRGACR